MINVLTELDLQCRQRRQVMTARLRLENQLSALARTVEKTAGSLAAEVARAISPVLAAHAEVLAKQQAPFDKAIAKLAERLPVANWVACSVGVGMLSVGLIIGETGDLGEYAGPAKVWRRLGLGVMPDGTRQRRVKDDPDEALQHGYCPRRRSLMHVVGTCFVRNKKSAYRKVYDERKAYELTRGVKPGPAHMRAMRYAEKRFVVDLWAAWRANTMKEAA